MGCGVETSYGQFVITFWSFDKFVCKMNLLFKMKSIVVMLMVKKTLEWRTLFFDYYLFVSRLAIQKTISAKMCDPLCSCFVKCMRLRKCLFMFWMD